MKTAILRHHTRLRQFSASLATSHAFRTSITTEERIKEGSDLLAIAILQHLKSKHQTASPTTVIEMRHYVFNHIFREREQPSSKSGCILLEKNDYNRCSFFEECSD